MVTRLRSRRVNCLKLRAGSFNSNGFYIPGLALTPRKPTHSDTTASDNSGMTTRKIMNGKTAVSPDTFKQVRQCGIVSADHHARGACLVTR